MRWRALAVAVVCWSCGGLEVVDGGVPLVDAGRADAGLVDAGDDAGVDAGERDAGIDAGAPSSAPQFATQVVSFTPGVGAGFGQDRYPDVVLGAPHGAGAGSGSLDVLSLGKGGVIVLELGVEVFDGPGVDLLVFENAFTGFVETGVVAVSDDGVQWREFSCDAADGGTLGCAGVTPVYSSPDNGIPPTDPTVAGGDGFDLAQLGGGTARYVRVRDSGFNRFYAPPGGGFDLDAIAAVNAHFFDGGAFLVAGHTVDGGFP